MAIQRLDVSDVRNLRRVRLEGLGRINVISGPNGSGKTSLLEAICLLGMGRSFRSSRISPLISHGASSLVVYGDVLGGDGERRTLGLSKGRSGERQARIDRQPVASLVEMVRALPLQVLDSESFSLVDGGPKVRRQFMDWGVFHVKPPFMGLWRRAQQALRQRNSLLRGGKAGSGDDSFDAWEQELARSAEQLDTLRQEYLEVFKPHLFRMLGAFVDLPGISLEYRRGWRADHDLLELLQGGRQKDREMGYTHAGPHRATLEIKVDGFPAAEILSRGQQKLLVASLKLAQGACLAEARGRQVVYLVDDLPAELDQQHRKTLSRLLAELGAQVFITSVDADTIRSSMSVDSWFQQDELRLFHVEQGEYRCLTK